MRCAVLCMGDTSVQTQGSLLNGPPERFRCMYHYHAMMVKSPIFLGDGFQTCDYVFLVMWCRVLGWVYLSLL
jgi:hypothetical protein